MKIILTILCGEGFSGEKSLSGTFKSNTGRNKHSSVIFLSVRPT